MTGIYIHIPFCNSKCPYCDFYSFKADENQKDSYLKAVLHCLEEYKDKITDTVDTVYFGGGTPSVFGGERISEIINHIKENYSLCDNAEITVECNPSSVTGEFVHRIKNAGVNRISMGMQSAVATERLALGRQSGTDKISRCISLLKNEGIDNISLDLMLGIPYQTAESLVKSIDFCSSLGVQHISSYMLKIEEGTPLSKSELRFLCADEEKVSDFYLLACEELEKRGFVQYEISNFAKDGKISFHNTRYWLDDEYIGIGPSAHSFMEGRRFFFDRSIKDFLEKPFEEIEREESSGGGWEEFAMLRLRLKKGLALAELSEKFPEVDTKEIFENAKPFEKPGLLKIEGNVISFTPKGFLLSNALTAEILY